MSAKFEMRAPPPKLKIDGSLDPQDAVEYVRFEMGGGHVVHRKATQDDRERYWDEYQAFRNPPPEVAPSAPVEPADATPPPGMGEAMPSVLAKVFGKKPKKG